MLIHEQLINWMRMKEDDVLGVFGKLPKAFSSGKGRGKFVFIEGTRQDKALLVAHCDTVWPGLIIKPKYENGIISSQRTGKQLVEYDKNTVIEYDGIGIGADDRAGCAILWELRNLGHSLLVVSGEESGGVASSAIAENEWWQRKIAEHSFAIEFDRHGSDDIVFYNVGTNKFVSYVKGKTKYTPRRGTFTDISNLCQDICGVNISVGYHNEHTGEEHLVLSQWQKTLDTARNWLSKPVERFTLDKRDLFTIKVKKFKQKGYTKHYDNYLDHLDHLNNQRSSSDAISQAQRSAFEGFIRCPQCNREYTIKQLHERYMRCDCGLDLMV